jgi:flagellar biosynthesis chaperone FliJ
MLEIDRISKNEERLDSVLASLQNLEKALAEFKSKQKDINMLNKYYGSKSWFKDKEAYENGKIPKVKAGVLSEDAVWNLNESIEELKKEIKEIYEKTNNRNNR